MNIFLPGTCISNGFFFNWPWCYGFDQLLPIHIAGRRHLAALFMGLWNLWRSGFNFSKCTGELSFSNCHVEFDIESIQYGSFFIIQLNYFLRKTMIYLSCMVAGDLTTHEYTASAAMVLNVLSRNISFSPQEGLGRLTDVIWTKDEMGEWLVIVTDPAVSVRKHVPMPPTYKNKSDVWNV